MHYFTGPLRDYFKISGRMSRKEYWLFFVWSLLPAAIAGFFDAMFHLRQPGQRIGPLTSIYILLTLIPQLTATIRRFRDAGWSGWWILMSFFPIVGMLWSVVLCLMPTDKYYRDLEQPKLALPDMNIKTAYADYSDGKLTDL